jgi:neutral amino acid transport system permease protein
MEVGLNRLIRPGLRGLSALIAGFLVFAGVMTASSAFAADEDPSTFTYTIAGTLQQDDVPITGVTLTASKDDKSYTTETDEFGEWTIMVPTDGVWKVEIDKTTLPDTVQLSGSNIGEADLSQTDFAAVLFKFGDAGKVETQSFGDQFLIRLFAGFDFGLMLAIAAIGITLIYGTTGLNNFAHGEMVTLGAMIMWLSYTFFQLNILVSGILAVAAVTAYGWFQDAAIWKPLRKRRLGLNQMMIVSIGFGIVSRYLLLLFFQGDTKDISGGQTVIQLGPIFTSNVALISMGISAVALAGVAFFLTRTRIGKATRAVSDNAPLAASTGIDVERIIRIVWLVAAGLTGLAGVLYGLQFQATWSVGFDILLLLFAAVTLGGLGTALGAAVGAMIIGLTVEISTLWMPSELKYVTGLVILIVILIVRPQGVLGKKQRIG